MSQITTHVLDTALGVPARGIHTTLFQRHGEDWLAIARGITNADGRVPGLLATDQVLDAGTYRMHFAIAGYFHESQQATFYPYVDVVFVIDGSGAHYHIPLLLSPFGYSTYRGS